MQTHTFTHLFDSPAHQRDYLPVLLIHYFKLNPKDNPERVMEAIDILESKGHVKVLHNPDTYKVRFECTVKGERAYNEGYYMKIIYKVLIVLIGSPILIGVLTQIPKLIKYLSL